MKVGDLVQYRDSEWCPVGLITGFDKDYDPIIMFINGEVERPTAYYRKHIKVISEGR